MTPWLIVLFAVLLLGGLAWLFVLHARAIRRDVDRRFEQLRAHLEREATSVLDDLLKGRDGA